MGNTKDAMMRPLTFEAYMICGFGIYDGEKGHAYNHNIFYKFWSSMIERCYSESMLKRNPTYRGTVVCEEWRYFSNFLIWAEENYIEGYNLDKDIISGDKKLYSPETCCFVPRVINSCILDKITQNEFPIGVSYMKKDKNGYERPKPFRASMSIYGKQTHLSTFSTPEEAHLCWQINKMNYLTDLTEKFSFLDIKILNGLHRRITILKDDIKNNCITKTINKV